MKTRNTQNVLEWLFASCLFHWGANTCCHVHSFLLIGGHGGRWSMSTAYNITVHDLILLFKGGETCASGLAVDIVCLGDEKKKERVI